MGGKGEAEIAVSRHDYSMSDEDFAVERLTTAHGGPFVPLDFEIPSPPALSTVHGVLRLEPLDERHNESDYAAWTGSIEHIRATRGYPWGGWPPTDGSLDLDGNLDDLRRHARHFAARQGFTWTVLDDSDECVGCVYLYPDRVMDADLHTWVVGSRADDDKRLRDHILTGVAAEWPFDTVQAH